MNPEPDSIWNLSRALYETLGDYQIKTRYSDGTEAAYETVKETLEALDRIVNNIGSDFLLSVWAENPKTHDKIRLSASVRVHLSPDGIVGKMEEEN